MNPETQFKADFLESLWTFFASIRLTVVVLLSLAALSIIGTLIPQNQNPADYFQAFGPFLYQVLATLDVFDMYHAWWFQGLILMLVLNIVVCSIDRLQKTWSILFPRTPAFNLEGFRKRKSRLEIDLDHPVDGLAERFEAKIARGFGHYRTLPTDNGFTITAEKGRWTRLGVYGVHLSIVVLLIGGLIGAKFGFEGYVNIPEGETADTIELRFSGLALKLDFAIRCEDFDVQFYEGGNRPKEFRSSLVIVENDRDVLKKDIVVNDPLRYKGISIYQSSYGKLNPDPHQHSAPAGMPEEIELNFQSRASGMIYALKARRGQTLQIPEGLGTFVLDSFQPEAEFQTMALGPAYSGTLTPARGTAQTVLLPVRFPKFDAMRQGEVIISVGDAGPGADHAPPEPRYYTGLQVAYDPGVWLVYTGFILMIAGCVVAFFMSHQQVVVEVTGSARGARVMIAGSANKNKLGLEQKLVRIAEKLKNAQA